MCQGGYIICLFICQGGCIDQFPNFPRTLASLSPRDAFLDRLDDFMVDTTPVSSVLTCKYTPWGCFNGFMLDTTPSSSVFTCKYTPLGCLDHNPGGCIYGEIGRGGSRPLALLFPRDAFLDRLNDFMVDTTPVSSVFMSKYAQGVYL